MNARQRKFCDEYLIDCNATQAAIRAGYNEKTAYSQGQRMLKNVEVKSYIDKRMSEKENERIASQDEVLEYLTSVMRGESQSEVVVVEGIGEGCSEARRVIKQPDEKERLKAAELIGKRYKLFTDKVEHEEKPIEITIKRKE